LDATTTNTTPTLDIGSPTPWGAADRVETLCNGIVSVSTPSHGGFFVPPRLNRAIPARWRAASFKRLGETGWYEEDCDWAMVALTFPKPFTARQRIEAKLCFDAMIRPKLPKFT